MPFSVVAPDDAEPAVDPRRFRRFRHAGAWKQPPDPWPDPEQRALVGAELDTVRDAIVILPEAQREVITMRDVLGLTANEVCDALEISEVNQRVLLHRARSRVRAALERHFGEGGLL